MDLCLPEGWSQWPEQRLCRDDLGPVLVRAALPRAVVCGLRDWRMASVRRVPVPVAAPRLAALRPYRAPAWVRECLR